MKRKTNEIKKIRVEILGDAMINDVQEKGLNKNAESISKYESILVHHRPTYWTILDQV